MRELPEDSVTLSVDLGGTKTRLGLVSVRGKLLEKLVLATPTGGDPDALRKLLSEGAARLTAGRGIAEIAGVALPGIWDRDTCVMQRALNLPKLEGRNLSELFEQALGRRVALETDVNAAALAQYAAFFRSNSPNTTAQLRFVYLSIGTGVGGAVVLNGQLKRHTRGGPGHFGHLIVDTSAGAAMCKCGARGCVEASIAGDTARRIDSAQVVSFLATALHQIAIMYAPDVICLAGGVVDANPDLASATRTRMWASPSSLYPPQMRIERAPLGADDAGLIGAARLVLPSS